MRISRAGRRLASLAAAVAVATLAGCNSGGTSGSADASGATPAGTSSPVVADAKQALSKATAWPTTWVGPTDKVQTTGHKKITIVSCSQATACAAESSGMQEAAKALGWDSQVVDGKGDPAAEDAAIRNAVTGGSDGIILASISPSSVKDALQFAKDHNVPVVNNAAVTAAQDGVDQSLVAGDNPDDNAYIGTTMANWLIAESNGSAQVVIVRTRDAGLVTRDDAVVARLKECPGCKILDQIYVSFDTTTTPKMSQLVNSILDREGSKVKYILTPYSSADSFVVPVLASRGRTDIKIGGYAGTNQQVQLCQQGKIGAIIADDLNWVGWEGVDLLNRAFAKEPPVKENTQYVLETSSTCPASGNFTDNNKFDYRGQFKALWGLS